jgi:hypothetical protein
MKATQNIESPSLREVIRRMYPSKAPHATAPSLQEEIRRMYPKVKPQQ